MDTRDRRLAENEILFREINDRIKTVADTHGPDEHLYEFLCECSNRDCTLRLELTVADYERLRADPLHFAVAVGHNLPEIERVAEQNAGYWVVEKMGEAADLAEEHDPR